MEDDGGGRRHAARAGAAAAAAAKKKKKKKNDGAAGASSSSWRDQPLHPVPFAQLPGVAGEVHARLEELGATEPSFMIGKPLVKSDVDRDQARLLFSCKREAPARLVSVITDAEMRFVEDKTAGTGGLLVAAFDRAGRRYDLVCKYLDSNAGYRFITGWKKYVAGNGLGVDTIVELWWFRSRKLHNRREEQLRQNKGGKEVNVVVSVTLESGHPDGSLGLVLLHYQPEGPEQAAADDQTPAVQETGHMESKTTTIAEDKLPDDGGTCAKSKTKLADDGGDCAATEICREDVLSAAKGLLMLREIYGRRVGGRGPAEPES